MSLEKIIPAIFLIAVLILVLPGFLKLNSKLHQFLKNLFIWCIIVASVMIVSYLIIRWKK
jgi:purine-cytosine permease-like protein